MFSQSPFHLFFFNSCSSSPPLSQPDKIVVKISPPLVVIFQHLIHFWRLIANDWDGWDQDLTTFDMFATHFFDKCLSNGINLGLIFIWRIDYKTIRYFETILPFNTLTSCLFVFVYLSEICLNGSSAGLHKLWYVLISWADRGSCAHKCVLLNF